MAKYIVPSKAASGAQTFSDNLVGNQITNGTSQLTNTNFDIDRVIPEKDNKNFKTSSFSEFLTLENLKKDTTNTTSQSSTQDNTIKFKSAKKDASVSLFGSLSSRISVSITNIINKYPSGFLIDKDGFISATEYTANDILFNEIENTTEFSFEVSRVYNSFDLTLKKPNTSITIDTDNSLRNFYSAYKNYVIDLSGTTYEILEYSEPDFFNVAKFKVLGEPFSGFTGYTENILIRPKNGIIEEFFNGLDILETQLLNRETNPIFTSTFIVPKDNDDTTNTILTSLSYTWPTSKDGWNIQISGIKYNSYVTNLSDVANQIDDYKSNLILRFLSSPQLFEFDTDNKKSESIFQLYGQSFDNVKKFIDNIAYMRNVSYDGINNLPDILLKNLSETLGLTTINLFDEKKFEDSIYTRLNRQYEGESIGKNLLEAEYEFYRRLLVNLSFIYKSKGTRTAIEFFLKFLGAPEPLIKIDEYVYQVNELPKSKNLEDEIFDVIQGSKVLVNLTFNPSTYSYEKTITSGNTTFTRDGYPVVENTLVPRRAFSLNDDIYFQKGSGWYDVTIDHRGTDILDIENSILTGRTKTLKTKMKPYTYGEDYFDVFRTLPGLDTGYVLESIIDNNKTNIVTEDSKYILNRKNIEIYISPARAIDYDIWSKSNNSFLTFGTNTFLETGVTFAQFIDLTLHSLIKNSNVIKYKKNYIQLEEVYKSYFNSTGFTAYNYIDSNEFILRMSPYWVDLISQVMPATTLWRGGNLIENSIFGRSKYKYNQPCQPLVYENKLYPDFETVINTDLETILGQEDNLRGLIQITGVTFYPIIQIDDVIYSGETYSVVVSGVTNTTNSASLLNSQFEHNDCSNIEMNDYLPLIFNYKDYLQPDIDKIKELWFNSLINLIEDVVNMTTTKNNVDYYDYTPYLNITSGDTHTLEYVKKLDYIIYKDENNIEKIKFISIKNEYNQCSVNKSIDYTFEAIYRPITPVCNNNLSFINDCDFYEGETDECILNKNLYFNLNGIIGNINSSIYVYENCDEIYTPPLEGENLLSKIVEFVSGCTYVIKDVKENDNLNFSILNVDNCELKIKINGLQLKVEHDSTKTHNDDILITVLGDDYENIITGTTLCDNYTGYTIIPKYEVNNSINYGLLNNSYVYCIPYESEPYIDILNGLLTVELLNMYIDSESIIIKNVKNVMVGDIILCVNDKPCDEMSNQDIKNGIINNDMSFTYTFTQQSVESIECLGSVKTNIITGKTKNNEIKIFSLLPTTQIKVYTNKKIINGEIIDSNYFFDYRLPEDLIIKTENQYGDYLISSNGELIEIIKVELDFMTPNIYLNLKFQEVENDSKIINGNDDMFVIVNNKFIHHQNSFNDIKLDQYYFDESSCPDIPLIGTLERPEYTEEC